MGHRIRHLSNHLPHHVTGRTNNREDFPLPLNLVWDVLCDYLYLLHVGFSIEIHSFVLMPNHYHLICRDPERKLPKAMEFFMRETSKEIGRISGRINRIWGAPYNNSLIDSMLYFYHAYKYVYRNPIEAGLCRKVEDYSFSSLSVLLGQSAGILPLEEDPLIFNENLETTISWLNFSYKDVEKESIRAALKKRQFKFRKDPHNKKILSLEDWSSVPFEAIPKK
jgi:putative transposase